MLCEICGKENATIHLKKTINGVQSEQNLCENCAHKVKNYNFMHASGPFSEFFESFAIGDTPFNNGSFVSFVGRNSGKTCPLCRSTYKRLVDTGKVGCAKCYEVFASELQKTITAIHGNVHHVGKENVAHMESLRTQKIVDELSASLSKAVEEQRFEEAARLRDEIRALKNGEKSAKKTDDEKEEKE